MKKSKQILSLILCLTIVFSLACFSSNAAVSATKLTWNNKGLAGGSQAVVCVGESKTYKATAKPDGITVKYTSSDTKIVSVTSKGKITGKAIGKAVITASAGGLKTSYKVSVIPKITFSEQNRKDLYLEIGETSTRIAAAEPKAKITYTSVDPDIASVDSNGKVTAHSPGSTRVRARYGNLGGDSYKVIVSDESSSSRTTRGIEIDRPDNSSGSGSSSVDTEEFAREVIRLVNEKRTSNGLHELAMDDALMDGADVRAREIVDDFSHGRPDGTRGAAFALRLGGGRIGLENIAMRQKTPKDVVAAWWKSPGHKKNILNPDVDITGVGCYQHNGSLYWVQLFAG